MVDDARLAAATRWAQDQLLQLAGEMKEEVVLVPLSGDASFRRYFRIALQQPVSVRSELAQGAKLVTDLIVMDAPPAQEDSEPFVTVAGQLQQGGICVPSILAADLDIGFLLLEDFGDQLLLPLLNEDSVAAWYRVAMQDLLALQAVPGGNLPAYDREKLLAEMELFPEWFLGTYLELTLSEQEQALLDKVFSLLLDAALEQPQAFVHRDYHSRNLMVLGEAADHRLGMIDFQDAVVGPVTYDLVSLLKDCYIQWPRDRVLNWLDEYLNLKGEDLAQRQQWILWLDWMGMQRHIKVLGIFARLGLRDNKPQFFDDIPMVLSYVFSAAEEYPQFVEFRQWLAAVVLPAFLQKQPGAKAKLESWL